MTKIVLFLTLAALALSAQPAPPKAPPRPAAVPADATDIDQDSWRWVDKDSKVWIIKRTPFGIMRSLAPKDSMASGARPEGLPAGATQISEDRWRWVDADGKAWRYRWSHSVLMRVEEAKDADKELGPTGVRLAGVGTDALDLIAVADKGDSLLFSKPGPFGTYTWTKKKDQLNQDEIVVWERAKTASATAAKKD